MKLVKKYHKIYQVTKEEKTIQLNRYRSILLSMSDFLIHWLAEDPAYDERGPVPAYYNDQKLKTEKYFNERRLDRMIQQLERLSKQLLRYDKKLGAIVYIKEKTGYDLDIFDAYFKTIETLKQRVALIICQKKIINDAEWKDVATMDLHYQDTGEIDKHKEMQALILPYLLETSDTPAEIKIKAAEFFKAGTQKFDVGKIYFLIAVPVKQLTC